MSKISPSTRWPLFLGVGFFGIVGIALLASMWNIAGDDSATSRTSPEVAEAPASDRQETAPPATPEAHQQLVSEVINDLDREILIGNSPTKGNPDADVILMKFSDFQCSYCARATEQVETFTNDYPEDVLFVYKHFPLTSIHPQALPAAQAAWAAGQQDQFWPYHDALFANQAVLEDRFYVEIAEELGLDMEQFNRDRESQESMQAVARDLALANELQLSSTPTFVMDDILIPGAVDASFFAEALTRIQSAQ